MVVQFSASITLNAHDRALELRMNKAMKCNQSGQHIRLLAKRKCPCKMIEIIQDHEIKLESRVANNRRGPYITMNQMKRK
jgi:hypothetical protein